MHLMSLQVFRVLDPLLLQDYLLKNQQDLRPDQAVNQLRNLVITRAVNPRDGLLDSLH